MKHYNINKVIADAQKSWDNDERNKSGDNEQFKNSFILGWIKRSYENIYNDLPESKKYKSTEYITQ